MEDTYKKPGFQYFSDEQDCLDYILSELLATLQDDLDRMTYEEEEHYEDEDRATMAAKIHDIKLIELRIKVQP
jgi:hypothetical protein